MHKGLSKGERTKQRIIETSARLFTRMGYTSTSISRIGANLGISKATFYSHFDSKEGLSLAVLDYAAQIFTHHYTQAILNVSDYLEKIRVLVQAHGKVLVSDYFQNGCPLVLLATETQNERILERTREIIAAWKGYIAGIIKEGKEKGDISQDVDPQEIGALIVQLLMGSDVYWRQFRDISQFDMFLPYLEKLLRP